MVRPHFIGLPSYGAQKPQPKLAPSSHPIALAPSSPEGDLKSTLKP